MPHSAAGWRIEPPVSVPIAHGARPAATAAALPPELPPGTRSRFQGLSTGPYAEFSFDEPMANSSWLVLPSSGAPIFSTTVAVDGGRYASGIFDPGCEGTSLVQKRSLTASGTPSVSGAESAAHTNALSSSAAARSR